MANHNDTINTLAADYKTITDQLEEMPKYSKEEVGNFDGGLSTITVFQNGTFGRFDEPDTVVNGFYESLVAQVGERVDSLLAMQESGFYIQ